MAERDELGGPLGGHDAGELCGHERVALGERCQARCGLGRHAHPAARNGSTTDRRASPHVDHADVAARRDVAEIT